MAKPILAEPLHTLEQDIIKTLLQGHHDYRPDLPYPESYSDMQAAVRELLRTFEVVRRPQRIFLTMKGPEE